MQNLFYKKNIENVKSKILNGDLKKIKPFFKEIGDKIKDLPTKQELTRDALARRREISILPNHKIIILLRQLAARA